MGASTPGVVTLAALLVSGPAVWATVLAVRLVVKRWRVGSTTDEKQQAPQGPQEAPQAGNAEGREQMPGLDYVLALLGYAIGIGNLWRFPYMVGKWGGCAFVCAYVVCLFFVAMPLYLMEMVMGQHTRKSTLECFDMVHPKWMGVAWAQVLVLFVALGYYNILLAYSCIYIVGSLLNPLPWSSQGLPEAHDWSSLAHSEGSVRLLTSTNAAEDYWKQDVLNQFPDRFNAESLGPLQGNIVGALFVVWVMIFLSLAFGKKALAKVTWVTVVGPVFLLVVLLIRTSQLEGASDGVAFYVGKFDAHLLLDLEMWAGACGQILFSLSPGLGTAITLSSYSKPKEDVLRTCVTVALANSTFSLVGGFAIFGILGNLAWRSGRTVAQVADSSGTGLAFVAIAEGIQSFGSGANTMAVLFFVMLLSLGLDSTFAWAETMVAYVVDFRVKRGLAPRRVAVVGGVSLVLFVCGLPYCTRLGAELLDVMDHYCTSYYLLLGCCLESLMFNLNFGWDRLQLTVQQTTVGNKATPNGRRVWFFWRACLLTTVPLVTGLLFLRLLISDLTKAYMNYPSFLQAIGWVTFAVCTLLTPAGCRAKGGSTLPSLEGLNLESANGMPCNREPCNLVPSVPNTAHSSPEEAAEAFTEHLQQDGSASPAPATESYRASFFLRTRGAVCLPIWGGLGCGPTVL